MKMLIALASTLIVARAIAGDAPTPAATSLPKATMHRYLFERTFPAGARPFPNVSDRMEEMLFLGNRLRSLVKFRSCGFVGARANAQQLTKIFLTCISVAAEPSCVRRSVKSIEAPRLFLERGCKLR